MTDPSTLLPRAGQEYVSPSEEQIASEMCNELTAQLDRMYKGQVMRRQIHTKMHGCVKAAFVVEPNLPAHLKEGVFATAKTYHAWVRFSNASTVPKPDKKKDVRGVAIKLMGVPGEKLLLQEHLQQTQDFLLMSSETFFSRNVVEFRSLLAAATASSKLHLLLFALNPMHWSLLKRVSKSNVPCKNPAAMTYWSTQPYQFGAPDRAVKYMLKPSPENRLVNEDFTEPDYLRFNLGQTLYVNEVRFDFYVQFQTDAATMPVEDPTVPWESPFTKVATLIIPPQIFDSPEQIHFGENLSFNSWHSLPEHRPLGSFNRVRRRVYEALAAYRHEKNDEPMFEPADAADFLPPLVARHTEEGAIPVPLKNVVTSQATVLVDCTRETAFQFISSSEKLSSWMKKCGPVHSVEMVEVLEGPYDHIGAKRKVIFDNGDTIVEELIQRNPFANYAYRVTAFSNFVGKLSKQAFGQVWFDRVDKQTRIHWVYSYTYSGFFGKLLLLLFNKMVFRKFMQHSLDNAKAQIENQD